MTATGSLLTIGELTLDDVVFEDQHVDWKQAGGGALYSAVGAALWTDAAICSAVGPDYPPHLLDELTSAGIDLSAVTRTTECNSLGLWLLYESSGARHQFEKAAGGSFQQLDALRPKASDLVEVPAGVHLAPQSSAGHAAALADFQDASGLITLDLLIEPYIDRLQYTAPGFLRRVDAFLPSAAEVVEIWGHDDIAVLQTDLTRLGFEGVLVVKRGEEGVDVATSEGVTRVPAADSCVVDVTGAGDAFCGGFLAGLMSTGDPVLAAAHGVVSASFIVETRGALAALASLDRELAASRLDAVLTSLRRTS